MFFGLEGWDGKPGDIFEKPENLCGGEAIRAEAPDLEEVRRTRADLENTTTVLIGERLWDARR